MEIQEQNPAAFDSDSDDEPLIKLAKRSGSQVSVTSQSNTSTASSSISSTADEKSSASNTSSSKPLTAFAHFFNDTQHSIRKTNNAATFEEVSQVVLSMWESLEANAKLLYQKREEEDRRRFEKSIHSVLPALIEQSDISSDATATAPSESENTEERAVVTTAASEDNTESKETAEPSNHQMSQSSDIKKPIIISSKPNLNQVITLTKNNQIIVTTKTSGAAASADPVAALSNVKGITIIRKAVAVNPVTSESPTATSNQEPKSQPSTTTDTGIATEAKKQTAAKETASSPAPSPTGSTGSTNSASESARTSSASPTTLEESTDGRASTTPSSQQKTCKYSQCDKPSIKLVKGDEDFCSSKCVVQHCHERFKAWVTARS